MKGTAASMSVMKRVSLIFRAKADKALDRMEDPRETLDYSYKQQVEMLTRVRRGVADVATSRKRVELQMTSLQKEIAKRTTQAKTALEQGREDLARAALQARGAAGAAVRRSAGPVHPAAGPRGEADPRLAAARRQGAGLPYPEGDHQGDVHRRRGADPHQRGLLRDLGGHGRRRPGHPASRGQDRADAGPGRRDRRAARLRRPRGPRERRQRLHPGRAGQARRQQRASTPSSRR